MTATVIGATGFVGSHLVDLLTRRGISVCVMSNEPSAGIANYYQADITDESQVTAALNESQPAFVYHLAAVSSLSGAAQEARLAFDVNVWGTRNVMHASAALASAPRVLNVSSSQVYGPGLDGPFTETSPVVPNNMYATTKAMAETWVSLYGSRVEVITARSFNHTGPGQTDAFVLPHLVRCVAEIEAGLAPPRIRVGNINVERDFTDVRDVAAAYLALMERGHRGEVYNVCAGKYFRVSDLLETLLSLAGVKASVEIDTSRCRSNDSKRLWGDHSKLADHTGWKPTISIEQTLGDMLNYWRETVLRNAKRLPTSAN